MNRGSYEGRTVVDPELLASMRPRFMNRGSQGFRIGSSRSRTGFNEAPIHESGKCDKRRERVRGLPGFNEAPIHESGKCGDHIPGRAAGTPLQ